MDKSYIPVLGFLIFFTIIVVGIVLFFSQQKTESVPLSSFSLSPTTPQATPSFSSEPVVTTWQTYENAPHEFRIQYPSGWQTQEYPSQTGSMRIAFSPDQLPCGTCSYNQNGYFSILIYNTDTDPLLYSTFMERMGKVGKVAGYIPITILDSQGVFSENSAAFEYKGWVYDFVFDAHKSTLHPAESKIFQKALSSFEPTGLIFTK